MTVIHSRTGKKVRLSSSHKLFANERETVDEAFRATSSVWWDIRISASAIR